MREILFRAKRIDNGEWIEGQLLYFKSNIDSNKLCCVIVSGCEWTNDDEWFNLCNMHKVEPSTVGQYTGLKDKNGNKIFEGDILKDQWNTIYVVKYKNSGFYIYRNNGRNGYSKIASWNGNKEVIGNIHDNPELLEV